MYSVYAIQNESGKIYIGQTAHLQNRVDRHNKILPSKSTAFTARNSGNWKLVYNETYKTRKEAMEREKQFKSYRGRLFIKKSLITGMK